MVAPRNARYHARVCLITTALHLAFVTQPPAAAAAAAAGGCANSNGNGTTATSTPTALHFVHREEPKLLWSWSANRNEYVPSHLFNVVEKGGPTTTNWKFADSWIHAQPLRLPADF